METQMKNVFSPSLIVKVIVLLITAFTGLLFFTEGEAHASENDLVSINTVENLSLQELNPELANSRKTVKPGDVVAKYTLSNSAAKQLTKNFKFANGKIWNYGTVALGVFKQYGLPVSLALNLSIDAQNKNYKVFKKAADSGKGVKVTIIAGITPNLNTVKYAVA